jgi:hypothetical protein
MLNRQRSVLLAATLLFRQSYAAPADTSAAICGQVFDEVFADGFTDNWTQIAGIGVGKISQMTGGGISMQVLDATNQAVTLRSKLGWTAPTNFTFYLQADNHSGTLSDAALWRGDKGGSEIDLELQGAKTNWDEISKSTLEQLARL